MGTFRSRLKEERCKCGVARYEVLARCTFHLRNFFHSLLLWILFIKLNKYTFILARRFKCFAFFIEKTKAQFSYWQKIMFLCFFVSKDNTGFQKINVIDWLTIIINSLLLKYGLLAFVGSLNFTIKIYKKTISLGCFINCFY
jgi:hypothetical protein